MTELIPYNQLKQMAVDVSKSGLFSGIKTAEQAATLMMLCQDQNISPVRALMDFHIINGKPSLKSEAMLARFQRSGGKVTWLKTDDTVARARFEHEQGSIEVQWDMKRAQQAQLGSATWKKFPAQMLRARCISEGIRAVYPACLDGMYVQEEVEDFAPPPKTKARNKPEPVNVTPPKEQLPPPPSETKTPHERLLAAGNRFIANHKMSKGLVTDLFTEIREELGFPDRSQMTPDQMAQYADAVEAREANTITFADGDDLPDWKTEEAAA